MYWNLCKLQGSIDGTGAPTIAPGPKESFRSRLLNEDPARMTGAGGPRRLSERGRWLEVVQKSGTCPGLTLLIHCVCALQRARRQSSLWIRGEVRVLPQAQPHTQLNAYLSVDSDDDDNNQIAAVRSGLKNVHRQTHSSSSRRVLVHWHGSPEWLTCVLFVIIDIRLP